MKRYKTITAILTFCILIGFAVSCGRKSRSDAKAVNWTSTHLHEAIATMEGALLKAKLSGVPFDVDQIVDAIIKDKGADFFRSRVQTSDWLRVCADIERWTSKDGFNEAIAICDPAKVYVTSDATHCYLAITFAGEIVQLEKLPDFNVLDLKKWDK